LRPTEPSSPPGSGPGYEQNFWPPA
jgi:hypothetical protein